MRAEVLGDQPEDVGPVGGELVGSGERLANRRKIRTKVQSTRHEFLITVCYFALLFNPQGSLNSQGTKIAKVRQ